jgi:hypothetical protein
VSSRFTSPRIVGFARALLLLHLLLVAVSFMVFLPFDRRGADVLSIVRDVGAAGLLVAIGLSSVRLAAGKPLRWMDWLLHSTWTALVVACIVLRWGPFQYRLQPSPGSIDEFELLNRFNVLLTLLQTGIMVTLYSGIPIGTSLLAGAMLEHSLQSQARVLRILSVGSFAGAVAVALILRRSWTGSEATVGVIAGGLVVASFALAGLPSARGDRASIGILLCEAGLWGLLRFA